MAETKTIAVIGATGAQGGGLMQAILADDTGAFAARAITRKPDSDNAHALAAAGAEVVAGDSDDDASLERAFAGAHGVFCVTNFWEHHSPERELAQAANLARAAKAAGVFEINFPVFVFASVVSRSLRFFLVAALIYRYGPATRSFIEKYFNTLSILFVLLLIGGFVVIRHVL
jgi:uncharacterized protein YbjT (DUF2867 family)